MTETEATIGGDTVVAKEPGYAHQTFLVGDEIYLRRVEKDDARLTVSWRESRFPLAPSITESWITGDLPKADQAWFVILRKSDDRVVGSLRSARFGIYTDLKAYVDPFYGPDADRWQAEMFRLVLPWMVDEQARVGVHLAVAGDETATIATLLEIGAWEVQRSPGLLYRDGEWVDLVRFDYLHKDWVAKIGDPRDEALKRTGTGVPRPVPAKVVLDGDPPKNAILIGERVYLKPIDEADAKLMARMSRKETETDYGHPRRLLNQANQVAQRLPDLKERWPENIGFSVCLRENDTVIGEVGVIGVDYLNRHGESGSWMFDPDYRGRGYGSEAKHLLLEYAFDTLGLRAVESSVLTNNPRSAAALRKQGYRETGIINWTGAENGSFHGNFIFMITADEWRALPRAAATTGEVSS
jgi:RimJ/RimL family protein N-acetyltransferase